MQSSAKGRNKYIFYAFFKFFPPKLFSCYAYKAKLAALFPSSLSLQWLFCSDRSAALTFFFFHFEMLGRNLQYKSGKYKIQLLLTQIILKVAFIRGQGWQDCNALGVWGPKKEEQGQREFTPKSKQIFMEYFGNYSPGLVCITFLILVHFSLPNQWDTPAVYSVVQKGQHLCNAEFGRGLNKQKSLQN